MTLSKLSLRNAKRQARDYLVYFITIVMATALIYAFNGLLFSGEIYELSRYMESLPIIVVLASIVVVLIIGWLVSYTTKFMLTKRSRELGTYILLGVENKQVAKLFFQENLVIGSLAIVLGTLVGNLIFQAFRAITLTLFELTYTFSFAFSLKAVGLTLVYFLLIYLFALRKCHKRINRMKIYDLIYFDKQNEGDVIKKNKSRRKTFAVSIVLGVLGTILLLLRNLLLGVLGATLIIVFLYGFFISFSSGVPAYYDARPHKKYGGTSLIVFRSLSSKLATMGVIMATVSVLFTATMLAEGTGLLFSAIFENRAEQTTCFDLFIGDVNREEGGMDVYLDYIDANVQVRRAYQYDIYQGDGRQVMDYLLAQTDYWEYFEYDTLMAFSDYTALREMLGYPAAELTGETYLIHSMAHLRSALSDYEEDITVSGQRLRPSGQIYTESFTQELWDGNGTGFILVVPDHVLADQPVSHRIYAAMTSAPVSEEAYQELRAIRNANKGNAGRETIFSLADIKAEQSSMVAMTIFPLFYLALVLTMVAATILTIQLLSESSRYKRQYALLSELGMERREMQKSLSRQFAFFYAMPSIPPVLITIPFILALSSNLDPGVIAGPAHRWAIIGGALALFFGIYLIYILAAYTSFKRSVLPEALN